MPLERIRFLGLAVILILPPMILGQDAPAQRLAEPEAAAQKQSEKVIRDLFKEEYSKKAPADQRALAKKLLQQGIDTNNDPATRYVLFQEAMEIAAKYGDVETAMVAVTETAKAYEIDGLALKVKTLGTMISSARSPEAAGTIADACLDVIDDAVREEKFDVAKSLVPKAETAAKASKDAAKTIQAQKKGKEIADLQRESQKAKEAAKTLETNPADPDANLTLGRFLLVKGDVEKALTLLSRGADPLLRAAADKELAAPTKPEEQAAAGDAWWEASEKEKNPSFKVILLVLAKEKYTRGIVGFSGINKTRMEKRLTEIEGKMSDSKTSEGLGSSRSPVTMDKAVAWWTFDSFGGSEERDLSGNGLTLKISGAKRVAGVKGSALDLAEPGDRAIIGRDNIPPPWTLALWVLRKGSTSPGATILDSSQHCLRLEQFSGTKQVGFTIYGVKDYNFGYTVPPGKWAHLAFLCSDSEMKLYANGALVATCAGSIPLPMEGFGGGKAYPYQTGASFDEVYIFRRLLAELEIKRLTVVGRNR